MRRFHVKKFGLIAAIGAVMLVGMLPASVSAVSGAGFTTDATGEPVNRNLYDDKCDVYINGGPANGVSNLSEGDYFFAVLEPGGQPDPNDGGAKNLSDDNDDYTDRAFHVDGDGHIDSTTTTHEKIDDPSLTGTALLIQLCDYATTGNPGGVYILAICTLPDSGDTVSPSDCKYDAFKIRPSGGPPGQPLVISKTADATFDRDFDWDVDKSVDQTFVQTTAATYTFNYTVLASFTSTDSNYSVTGTITVENSNSFAVSATVTDALSDGTTCTVQNSGAVTVPAATGTTNGSASLTYSCSPTSDGALTNIATVTWAAQGTLSAGQDSTIETLNWVATETDACVDVDDTFGLTGSSGTTTTLVRVCADGTKSDALTGVTATFSATDSEWTITYSRTVNVPRNACATYDNTAEVLDESDEASVTVCGPTTGGFTIGFWTNKNGQNLIKNSASTSGVCNLTTIIRSYAPYQDLSATATCAQVATYVYNTIKGATCTSVSQTCDSMLKAQMLATILNVWRTPALGTTYIDTSDWAAAFGGDECMTVNQMLAYVSGQYSGGTFYGGDKTLQVLAKDSFDAINNNESFACVP